MREATLTDMIDYWKERSEKLETQVDFWRDRCQTLEDKFVGEGFAPLSWGLSASEEACVRVLAHRGRANKEQLRMSYSSWNASSDWSDGTIRQTMVRIRRKLAPHGIRIETQPGVAYFVDDETRKRLRAAFLADA